MMPMVANATPAAPIAGISLPTLPPRFGSVTVWYFPILHIRVKLATVDEQADARSWI
jgi:hypothetical protein